MAKPATTSQGAGRRKGHGRERGGVRRGRKDAKGEAAAAPATPAVSDAPAVPAALASASSHSDPSSPASPVVAAPRPAPRSHAREPALPAAFGAPAAASASVPDAPRLSCTPHVAPESKSCPSPPPPQAVASFTRAWTLRRRHSPPPTPPPVAAFIPAPSSPTTSTRALPPALRGAMVSLEAKRAVERALTATARVNKLREAVDSVLTRVTCAFGTPQMPPPPPAVSEVAVDETFSLPAVTCVDVVRKVAVPVEAAPAAGAVAAEAVAVVAAGTAGVAGAAAETQCTERVAGPPPRRPPSPPRPPRSMLSALPSASGGPRRSSGPLLPSLLRTERCVSMAPELQDLQCALRQYTWNGPYSPRYTSKSGHSSESSEFFNSAGQMDLMKSQAIWQSQPIRFSSASSSVAPLPMNPSTSPPFADI